MIYFVKYQQGDITIRRTIVKSVGERWQLKDGNNRNIRPFSSLAEAILWLDEERMETEIIADHKAIIDEDFNARDES